MTADGLLFMLEFHWNISSEIEGEFEQYSKRQVTKIHCTRSTGDCTGATLNIQEIDDGKSLGLFDLTEMVGASLADKARARRQIRGMLDFWEDRGGKRMLDAVARVRTAFEADISRLDTSNNRGFIVKHGLKVFLFFTVGSPKDWTITMYEVGDLSASQAHASCR